ncbi:MAG TPA: hypothetical protein PK867_20635 [Pirellulales bacterium]|nr:hypothetical protein [Pirellulales bacterium]
MADWPDDEVAAFVIAARSGTDEPLMVLPPQKRCSERRNRPNDGRRAIPACAAGGGPAGRDRRHGNDGRRAIPACAAPLDFEPQWPILLVLAPRSTCRKARAGLFFAPRPIPYTAVPQESTMKRTIVFIDGQSRWIKVASAFPDSATLPNRLGVNHTDWIRIDRATHDACIDPRNYRPTP